MVLRAAQAGLSAPVEGSPELAGAQTKLAASA
jgi:hypothetical protein